MPVLLGEGIPVLPKGRRSPTLRLEEAKPMPTGIMSANYSIQYASVKKRSRSANIKRLYFNVFAMALFA
jgi:hypothetical protein